MTRTRVPTAIIAVAFSLAMLVGFQSSADASYIPMGVAYDHRSPSGALLGGHGWTQVLTSPDGYTAPNTIHIQPYISKDATYVSQYLKARFQVWMLCISSTGAKYWCYPTAFETEWQLVGGAYFDYVISGARAGKYYVQVDYVWWIGMLSDSGWVNIGEVTVQ